MADDVEQENHNDQDPPKVVADFGGRRRIFERRLKQRIIAHKERRSIRNRRSGFDRRGALTQSGDTDIVEKRTTFSAITTK